MKAFKMVNKNTKCGALLMCISEWCLLSSLMEWREAPVRPQWKVALVAGAFPATGEEIMSNECVSKLGNSDTKNNRNEVGDEEIKANLIHPESRTTVEHNANAEAGSSEDTGLGSDESEGEAREEGRRAVSIVITSGQGRPALTPSAAELAALGLSLIHI